MFQYREIYSANLFNLIFRVVSYKSYIWMLSAKSETLKTSSARVEYLLVCEWDKGCAPFIFVCAPLSVPLAFFYDPFLPLSFIIRQNRWGDIYSKPNPTKNCPLRWNIYVLIQCAEMVCFKIYENPIPFIYYYVYCTCFFEHQHLDTYAELQVKYIVLYAVVILKMQI